MTGQIDIRRGIHEAIRRQIKNGYLPVAIILCAEANTLLVTTLQEYHRVLITKVETFEGLPVFVIPDEPTTPGRDFWIKIAVKQ